MKMSNTVLNASFVNISSVEHKEGPQFSLGYPCGSAGKEYSCNVGDLGLIPGLGGCPGDGKGYPLQYSGLENSMDYTELQWHPTPVLLPGKSHGWRSLVGCSPWVH